MIIDGESGWKINESMAKNYTSCRILYIYGLNDVGEGLQEEPNLLSWNAMALLRKCLGM
jgi:hypothetical protein